MSGKDRHVVAERKQFFSDAIEQKIGIATRQIPSTNATRKKDVAADKQLVLAREEAKTAGTMSWNFKHLHFQTEKFFHRSLFDEKVGLNRFNLEFKPEAAKEFSIGDHRRGFRMTTDWATEAAFDFGHVGDVIEMAMCQQEKFQVDIARSDPIASTVRCVEQNPALGSFKQIAIRFENTTAKGLVPH